MQQTCFSALGRRAARRAQVQTQTAVAAVRESGALRVAGHAADLEYARAPQPTPAWQD